MQASRNVTLAGRSVLSKQHICAFFGSKEEEYRVLLPFFKEGFERGERVLQIVDPAQRAAHMQRLAEAGVPVEEVERKGQLDVLRWQDAYLRDGRFDQDGMLELVEQVLSDSEARGFPLTRAVGNMEWSLEERPGVDDIVEYESRLNQVLANYGDTVLCVYDLTKFNATVVMDILRTHPMVIIGGILQENPFYVPPEELLRELRGRA